jgi:NADPH:quinone reductase-like Zn-dependent oxidoreductase
MGADAQNAEAGTMGAGSGGPPATMRAVVLDAPGPPSALAIRELPVPVPPVGWVLIRVRAFGLNRLELYLRLGLSQGVTFPRVPGVEAAGVVEQCPGGDFRAGQQVAAFMGGMGRVFDGGSWTPSPPARPLSRSAGCTGSTRSWRRTPTWSRTGSAASSWSRPEMACDGGRSEMKIAVLGAGRVGSCAENRALGGYFTALASTLITSRIPGARPSRAAPWAY